MNLLDALRQKRTEPSAILHRFRMALARSDEQIFVFVEGDEDRDFLRPVFQKCALYRKIDFFVCNGKAGVLRAREKISEEVIEYSKCMFFIDKDFDDYLGTLVQSDKSTFVTMHYSIENYLAVPEVVEAFFNEIVKAEGAQTEEIVRCYKRSHERFLKLIKPFMVWAISLKRRGELVHLANVNLANVIEFDASLYPKRNPNAFRNFTVPTGAMQLDVTCADYRKARDSVQKVDPQAYVRGKFELWFVVEFLKRSWELICEASKGGKKKKSIHIQLTHKNAICILSPLLDPPPDDLERFLASFGDIEAA